MKSTGRCHRAKNAGNVMECRTSKKPMLFFRQKRAFIVSIEYEGELPAYARLATSPEIFRVYAVSSGAAHTAELRDWIDEYDGEPPAYARWPPSPEFFRVYAVSSGAAQRAAIRDWIDKYQASPRQITK